MLWIQRSNVDISVWKMTCSTCVSILLPCLSVLPQSLVVPHPPIQSSKNIISPGSLPFNPHRWSGDQCRAPAWCSGGRLSDLWWVSSCPPQTIACCASPIVPPFTTTLHICILHTPPSPPALWNLHSLCMTPPCSCSVPHHGRKARMLPLLFSREGLGGGKFGDIWTYLSALPLCAQPAAFPLTAAWTCPNVYEPPPLPPRPHFTFLRTYGDRPRPAMTSTSVLFMSSRSVSSVKHCVAEEESLRRWFVWWLHSLLTCDVGVLFLIGSKGQLLSSGKLWRVGRPAG